MAKKRSKPKNPEQIAAEKRAQRVRDFAAVEMQPEAASLPSSASIEVRRDNQRTVAGARRWDAFDALREGMTPGAYDAARRLEADMRQQRGEVDRGRSVVRGGEGPTDVTDARLAAGDRVRIALSRIGDRDALLLTELIYPSIPRETWRDTVAVITGEENQVAQAAAVRSACANLALAYAAKVAA